MDTLRPGHAHRSGSYRLLSNYLDTQKTILNTLLTLLSHSHSATSSLLAYSTSSPGILPPIRRSVRHAAFEGPLSPVLLENHETGSQLGSLLGKIEDDAQGWALYVGSLERFRKELKELYKMEEEITRVKRDREILVSRLIKTTKARPTKSDLTAIASTYRPQERASSRASLTSVTSGGSTASKEGKRAGKLADAQAELLGCEEHLRSLELQIEEERNKVMLHGLEERFRAMEAVGRMWVSQAKKGLVDLGRMNELSADAFELDSNPSISPSQSASQYGHDDMSPRRGGMPFPRLHHEPSITGSIAEEDENGSSADEGKMVVHENGARGTTPTPRRNVRSPLGVPSIGSIRARPMSTDFGPGMGGDGSDSDVSFNPRSGGRRAASDIGTRGYNPPRRRSMLRRTNSDQRRRPMAANERADSDASSARDEPGMGGKKKKRGFFRSIVGFFQGPPRPLLAGRDSPPYGESSPRKQNNWRTRTDNNVKRSSSMFGPSARRQERDADSSSDDEPGNFVSVNNLGGGGGANTWSAGSRDRDVMKRSSTMPVASGLIPPDPKSGRTTPAPSARSITPKPNRPVSRSGTVKSVASNTTAKSGGAGSVKSTGTAKKRIRPNGSISRVNQRAGTVGSSPNIMSLVEQSPAASMPEVPKAPKSQTDPLAGSLPKAPGTSIVKAEPIPKLQVNGTERPRPVSRSSSRKVAPTAGSDESSPKKRSTTPLPPSRTLSPPLKSALRPSSPATSRDIPALSPPIEPPKTLFSVSAPGPVNVPREEPKPVVDTSPKPTHRQSYQSSTGETIYDTAEEGDVAAAADDTSESEVEEEDDRQYQVVDNDRIRRLGIHVGPPQVEKVPDEQTVHETHYESAVDSDSDETAGPHPARDLVGQQPRRKSVRMDVPESTSTVHLAGTGQDHYVGQDDSAEMDSPGLDGRLGTGAGGMHEQWSTRIGKMREDTTDESEGDDEYRDARKGLMRNSGQWELAGQGQGKKGKRSASIKSGRSGKAR